MELTIKDIIDLLLKRKIWIIVFLFVGLVSSFSFSKLIINPSYTASVQLYVIPNEAEASVNLSDLNFAQKVVTTYISFLNTNVFYKRIQDDTGLHYTVSQLMGMTSMKIINNTEIFQISVTSYKPEDSYTLAESMERIAPQLIKEINSTAKLSVVDPVNYPSGPSGPNIVRNTMIGGMSGLMLAFCLILIIEFFDVNVKNKEDLITNYQLPVLGEIPNIYLSNDKGLLYRIPFISKRLSMKHHNKKTGINDNLKFIFSEAFKALRTNLRFALIKEGCKKIIISSPLPNDGKSTTSINLGITIAQTGARVLIIDCDLRKGEIHNYFKIKYKPGLSDAISGMADVKDVTKRTGYENLDIIPLGTISPNPSELLSSNQMDKLLLLLEKEYNYILFDTPPINILSDPLSLVKYSDGLLLVVRERVSSHSNIKSALEKFKLSQGNILGFILNDVRLSQDRRMNHYYTHYGASHD